MQISFTPEFAARLETDLRLKGQGLHNPHGGGNTYELERALDEDMLLTSIGWVNGYYQNGYQDVDNYQDEWGVTGRPSNMPPPLAREVYRAVRPSAVPASG